MTTVATNETNTPSIHTLLSDLATLKYDRFDEGSKRMMTTSSKEELTEIASALENVATPVRYGLAAIGTLLATHNDLESVSKTCMSDIGWLMAHLAETLEAVESCADKTKYYLTGFEIAEANASIKR